MLEYEVVVKRVDSHGSLARCKDAKITLDTDAKGRADAFNPAELLLTADAACILKNIERISPINHFEYRGVKIRVHGICQDAPPRIVRINYEVTVDTDEDDRKLALMHENIKKFGTIYNTVASGAELNGVLQRSKLSTWSS